MPLRRRSASANVEGVIVVDLDLNPLQRHRERGAVRTRADRRPDLYRQWADCAPNAL